MNEFVKNLNEIKKKRNKFKLTKSQQKAYFEILDLLQVPRFVNLHGHAGVGKTFLGWRLADELNWDYIPHISHLGNVKSECTIIDNFPSDRQTYRDAIYELRTKGISKAVLITRKPIRDYIAHIPLLLTEEDIEIVKNNLAMCAIYIKEITPKNLWYLLNPTLGDVYDRGAQSNS